MRAVGKQGDGRRERKNKFFYLHVALDAVK
jgi:hypothetical protein